jgi:outer membrane lipoprotein SlyB
MFKNFLISALLITFLTACGIGNTNTTYSRGQIGRQGSTSVGRIVSMTQIDVAGTNSGIGTTVGALAGGIAGGALTSPSHGWYRHSRGRRAVGTLGALGGAVVGGIAGSLAEKALTKDTAFEFLVEKPNGAVVSIVQTNELGLREGDKVILIDIDGTTRIRQKVGGKSNGN